MGRNLGEAAASAGLGRQRRWSIMGIKITSYTMLEAIPAAGVHLIALFCTSDGV